MYLTSIDDENIGPIEKINIKMPFDELGNPKPIILVGENGSGKSMILSNIVDSLYEFVEQSYNDMTVKNNVGGHDYFKIITSNQIKIGKTYAFSYLKFKDKEKVFEYLMKNGNLNYTQFKEKNSEALLTYNSEKNNIKETTKDPDFFKDEFEKSSYCYFSPNRYSKPEWLNKKYIVDESITVDQRFSSELKKPINIEGLDEFNLSWLLDIIVDSRPDIIKKADGSYSTRDISNHDLDLMSISRKNIEEILSEILGEDVHLSLNFRNSYGARFNIKNNHGDTIIPTLDSLSTGQMALFNMFATIIKYADRGDINKSIHISDITGIVIIDEIELHLHSILQKEVLPNLIKKFPKVQFIITSHSPLFLLGMEDVFGKSGFEIYNLPNGEKIGTESFSEFKKSYDYMKNTDIYRNELKDNIDKQLDKKTVVVTEGCTDWRHMVRALSRLKENERYKEDFKDLDIEFIMYDDSNVKDSDFQTFDMGDTRLISMCEYYSRIRQNNKIIFIGDRDKKEEEILSEENKKYKKWNNNVYSFQIPVPEHRRNTPNICIEHYYTDDEIKREFKCNDGIIRRLYMGNEFNSNGLDIENHKMCKCINKCGTDKIDIIEGSSKDRVTDFNDENKVNYALSKKIFADNIYNEQEGFENIGYESFKDIFYIIKDIEKENLD